MTAKSRKKVIGYAIAVPFIASLYALAAGCVSYVEVTGTDRGASTGEDSAPDPIIKSKWLVLKCKLKDVEELPPEASKIDDLLHGPEGVQRYFQDISYGEYTPHFTVVDWVTQDQTTEDDVDMSRGSRITNCIKAHKEAGTITSTDGYKVIVLRNVSQDSGAADGKVLLDIGAWTPTFAAHEMGHGLGLGHSWDTSDRKNSSWSKPGEYYDPWDIMSAMAVYRFTNSEGLPAGPDMDTSSKIKLGWMSEAKLYRTTLEDLEASKSPVDVTLDPYNQPDGANPLAVVIERSDASQPFYTIEFRTKTGWDRGIPKAGIMIHHVTKKGKRPYLMPGGAYQASETFVGQDGLQIEIVALDETAGSAKVRLSYNPEVSGRPAQPDRNIRIPDLDVGPFVDEYIDEEPD
jgi:hypothetical protein